MPVNQLLAEVDSRELSEWIAFDQIHIPESWHQTGLLCAVLMNALGNGKREWKPADFLPRKRKRPRSPQEWAAKMRAFADSYNASLPAAGGGQDGGLAFG